MKVIESAAAAVVVAGVVALVASRTGADWTLAGAVSFLVMFVAAYMKPRTATPRRSSRRR